MSEVNQLEIQVPEHLQGGIWSNMVAVSHSQYEFTLDFVRKERVKLTIPNTREISAPLIATILKQAGISRSDWLSRTR